MMSTQFARDDVKRDRCKRKLKRKTVYTMRRTILLQGIYRMQDAFELFYSKPIKRSPRNINRLMLDQC